MEGRKKEKKLNWKNSKQVEEFITEKLKEAYDKRIIMEQNIQNVLDSTELVLTTKVKAFGNSAHIPIPKKYLDKEVKVIILKKQEDKES